jgi:dihydrofolate synthase/folylpolyglutamate synthase
MNYLEAISYIESLSPTLEKPGLSRIGKFMAAHGDCQNQYKVFHVGGTNGKGSTAAILDSIIQQTGKRVGRFTGPHLLRWNERFHLDGQPIEDAVFAELATTVQKQSQAFGRSDELGPLTWFEFLTALAFQWFAANNVDFAVMEVGLGGRFDATNIVENVAATIITNIDLDHTHILGDTVEQIAFEKAGIVKAKVPVVTGALGAAWPVISEKCKSLEAPLYSCDAQFNVTVDGVADERVSAYARQLFDRHKSQLALGGSYQLRNAFAATVALVASGVNFGLAADELDRAVGAGFAKVYWPGRWQSIASLKLILDGAHNPAGARELRKCLDEMFPHQRRAFVISCFENKNAPKIVDELGRPGDRLFLSEAAVRRATYDKEELADYCRQAGYDVTVSPTIAAAYEAARLNLEPNEMIVCTGSFATLREVMQHLHWQLVEDGRPECAKIIGSARVETSVESM